MKLVGAAIVAPGAMVTIEKIGSTITAGEACVVEVGDMMLPLNYTLPMAEAMLVDAMRFHVEWLSAFGMKGDCHGNDQCRTVV